MATSIMLSTLTDDGRETLQERPERIGEVNREVAALGARAVGPCDFVKIVEVPDNETISAPAAPSSS